MPEGDIVAEAAKLVKGGLSGAQVGAVLRDSYGIPSVHAITGQRMQDLLASRAFGPNCPRIFKRFSSASFTSSVTYGPIRRTTRTIAVSRSWSRESVGWPATTD